MKSPTQAQINKLHKDSFIFYDFPRFCGGIIEKYISRLEWGLCQDEMAKYKLYVGKMSSMLFRLIEHLEDWNTQRNSEEARNRARDKSILGMLLFVPVVTDFCITVIADEGVVGEHIAKYFSKYVDTFSEIWNSAVEIQSDSLYPAYMPSRKEFEPYAACLSKLTDGMDADDDFKALVQETDKYLRKMDEDIKGWEVKNLLERQYLEADFARALVKAVQNVDSIMESLSDAGYKDEKLDKLASLLKSVEVKYRICDKFYASAAEDIFGRKHTRLSFSA